jgi:DNA invertase Pin-like site-specific DNA recombinase
MDKDIQYTNTTPLVIPKEEGGVYVDQVGSVTQVRYCLYARKSSEDDERQALSIDSQIKEMAQQAQALGLRVTEIRNESHSAKATGQRPVFNQLLEDIRKGEFQGILAWAPDRLSRNAGDLGSLVDLMDGGLLREIRTHGQSFTNSPNDKFMLMILCSQAKLENDNRGINVKRGQRAKCEMGVRPNFAPVGYLNDYYMGKGLKKVFVDQERAPIIKQAFEKVAYEGYSGRKIYEWLKTETTLRSKSGKVMNLSVIYRMLNNPYYCGMFKYGDKWYKGSYEPIITKELFDAAQKKMTVTPKSKPGTRQYDFTRLFKCGTCGSGITAQEITRHYDTGTVKRYVYYHCTQSKNFDCPERYINEEKLVKQLAKLLKDIPVKEVTSRGLLKPELDKFMVITLALQDKKTEISGTKTDLTDFVRYVFQDGTKDQKRELIGCLKATICLKDRQLQIQN